MNELILRALKIRLNGAENSPCIEKCPANEKDVMAALQFLDENSELVVTLVDIQKDESGNYVEVSH